MLETDKNEKTIDQLNSFLRGELSAVETYRQALAKLTDFPQRSTLEECARSHSSRVEVLQKEIVARGGQPAFASGMWGAFAKAVEGSAATAVLAPRAVALEEGEDHGRNDYLRDTDKLDSTAKQMMMAQIIPEQKRTHDAMSKLKKSLS